MFHLSYSGKWVKGTIYDKLLMILLPSMTGYRTTDLVKDIRFTNGKPRRK